MPVCVSSEPKYVIPPGTFIRLSRRVIILSCKPGPRTAKEIVEDTNLSYGGPVLREENGTILPNLNPDRPEVYVVPNMRRYLYE